MPHWLKYLRRLTLLLTVILGGAGSAAADQSLYLSFDQGFEAIDGQGKAVSLELIGNPEVVAGRVGHAARVGSAAGQIRIPSAGVLDPREGSVELWVMPVDWTSDDGKFHVFFDARGAGALILYKYLEGSRLLMLTAEQAEGGPYYSDAAPISWNPSQWHHVVGTWSAEGVRLFVDGEPAGSAAMPAILPTTLLDYFTIGDLPWSSTGRTASLIDEVRIYDTALSAREVQAHYAGEYVRRRPLTAEDASLSYEVDRDRHEVSARLQLDVHPRKGRSEVRFELLQDSRRVAGTVVELRNEERAAAILPVPARSPGTYRIRAALLIDGEVTLTKESELIVPDLERMSSIDEPDVPLAPWSGPEFSAGGVTVWGRRYEFGRAYLPRQIQSAGRDLLSRPINLQGSVAGRRFDFSTLEQKVETPAQRPVRLISEISADIAGAVQAKLRVTATTEYDGLMRIVIDAPQGMQEVEELILTITMPGSRAALRHRSDGRGGNVSGALAPESGVIDSTQYVPWYWFGDDEAGLFWFAESGRSWPGFLDPGAIKLQRQGEEVSLQLTLKAGAALSAPTWRYEFGLQATPVRAARHDRRHLRLTPSARANVDILWPTPTADSFLYYGYPQAADPVRMRERVERSRRRKVDVVPYACVTCLSTATPEWKFFRKEWSNGLFDSTPRDVRAYAAGLGFVSPRAPAWNSFIASKLGDLLEEFAFRGVYLDNIRPYGAYAPSAGLGFSRGERRYLEYPILGYRDTLRQVRSQVHRRSGPDAIIIAHSSGEIVAPMLGFADAYVSGEQFRGKVRDTYLDVLTLEQFRAEFAATQWGVAPIFLPQFDAVAAKKIAPTRGLMGLLMLHDVGVWPVWCNVAEVDRALDALHQFRYEDAQFIPYFSSRPPASTARDDVRVSAYRREGRTLLVVGNLSRDRRNGRICLNEDVLGRPERVLTWPGQKAIALDSSACVNLELEGLDYRLLVLDGPLPATQARNTSLSPSLTAFANMESRWR